MKQRVVLAKIRLYQRHSARQRLVWFVPRSAFKSLQWPVTGSIVPGKRNANQMIKNQGLHWSFRRANEGMRWKARFVIAIAQDYENFEILVSDNNSSDNTRDVVSSCTDKRVRYCNPGRRLNMSANWDFALSNLGKTDFVAIMGDDDGILPGAVSRIAEVLTETGVKALRTTSCDFHWPKRNGKEHGRLTIERPGGVEIRNGRDWLNKVLNCLRACPTQTYLSFIMVA